MRPQGSKEGVWGEMNEGPIGKEPRTRKRSDFKFGKQGTEEPKGTVREVQADMKRDMEPPNRGISRTNRSPSG